MNPILDSCEVNDALRQGLPYLYNERLLLEQSTQFRMGSSVLILVVSRGIQNFLFFSLLGFRNSKM